MAVDEVLDLVNDADVVVGSMERGEVYSKGLSNYRVINCFLRNSKGALWIPRRTAHKRIFPSCFDFSVGGHVSSGEDYDLSFRRELEEELGINLDKVQWRVLGDLQPYRHGVSSFMRVYEITTDEAPDYNPSDFTEAFWMMPEVYFARVESGEGTKEDLPKLVNYFYNPDGTHKQLPRDRAVGLVFNSNGELFLMKRQKDGKDFWVFPGGGWDIGESLPEAVAREMMEEGSFDVKVKDLVYGVSFEDGSYHYFCDCGVVDGEPKLKADSIEEGKMRTQDNWYWPQWVSVAQLAELPLYPLELRDLLVSDLASHGAPQKSFLQHKGTGGLLKMAGVSKT